MPASATKDRNAHLRREYTRIHLSTDTFWSWCDEHDAPSQRGPEPQNAYMRWSRSTLMCSSLGKRRAPPLGPPRRRQNASRRHDCPFKGTLRARGKSYSRLGLRGLVAESLKESRRPSAHQTFRSGGRRQEGFSGLHKNLGFRLARWLCRTICRLLGGAFNSLTRVAP